MSAADRVRGKVTFSKFQGVSGDNVPYSYDDKESRVFVDGADVGTLTANMIDLSQTSIAGVHRVAYYEVDLQDGPDDALRNEAAFPTENYRKRAPSARQALKDARDHVREFYNPSPNRPATGIEVEAMATAAGVTFDRWQRPPRVPGVFVRHLPAHYLVGPKGARMLIHDAPIRHLTIRQWHKKIAQATSGSFLFSEPHS